MPRRMFGLNGESVSVTLFQRGRGPLALLCLFDANNLLTGYSGFFDTEIMARIFSAEIKSRFINKFC